MTRELHLAAIRARYAHEWCLTESEKERHIAVETAFMEQQSGVTGTSAIAQLTNGDVQIVPAPTNHVSDAQCVGKGRGR